MKKKIYSYPLSLIAALFLLSPARYTYASDANNTIYESGQCLFRITDLKGGFFSVDNASHIKGGTYSAKDDWSFPLYCYTSDQETMFKQLSSRKVGNAWISLDTNKPFLPSQHFSLQEISGKNWRGLATGYDLVSGPEDSRQRMFFFCLSENQGKQMLCGQGMGLGTSSPATTKTIQSILDVVESIEFVNSTDSNKP